MSDLSDEAKTAQLRRGLNADWVVWGTVSTLGRDYLITAQLIDLNSQELMAGVPVQMSQIEEALIKMDGEIERMARRLTGGAGGSGGQATAAAAVSPPAVSVPKSNIFTDYLDYSIYYAYRNNLYLYQPMAIIWDDSDNGLGFEFLSPIGFIYSPLPYTSIGISFIIFSIFKSEFYGGLNTSFGIVLPLIAGGSSLKIITDFLMDFGGLENSIWNIKKTIGIRPGFDIGLLFSISDELFMELKYQNKWYSDKWLVHGLSFAIGWSIGERLVWW
jgi:hypothetical protein